MPGPEPPRGRYRRWRAALLLPVLACAGGGNSAPRNFLPSPEASQQDPYGGWIELTIKEHRKERQVEGELIAVSADSVWLLHTAGGGEVVPTSMVEKGKLTGYRAATGAITGYSALGVASTVSNGAFLVFTAPLWILTGTLTGASEAQVPRRTSPPLAWPDLAEFARFPQGMPEGVALESLTPKPKE